MSAIFDWELCGVGVKRGSLFGTYTQYPLLTINMGVAKVVVLRGEGKYKLREALEGLMTDPDWMVKNNPAVMKAKLEVERAVRAQDEDRKDEALERRRVEVEKLRSELDRRRHEVVTLREAFRMLGGGEVE